ncbi:caspase, EACC1-associated type [Phytomonospora endophytica]|uniref:Peptidase C14 caspase domain-containing protein n=1 Tax=Phytomonospora endophytica TaxID=714109 RepID=A0A841FQH9_9ACTN|nr:caspase family protein [Phytomonospora endophytica]MBB6035507.1 hypothetical protein [Phytomonospora endophytica]GIG63740.1 hypothetical protein Pen01_00350 [Phytomonospora endophytica]
MNNGGTLADPHASRAVLIGVADYHGDGIPRLPAVVANITGLSALLRDPEVGNLPDDHVTAPVGTEVEILAAVRTAAARTRDTLIVYFAGHGFVLDGELCLGLSHSQRADATTTLRWVHLRDALASGGARHVAVILDCCHAGFARDDAEADMVARLIGGRAGPGGLSVLTATAPTRRASAPEGAKYTAFTGELIALLTTGADDGPPLFALRDIHRRLHPRLTGAGEPAPGLSVSGRSRAFLRNRAVPLPARRWWTRKKALAVGAAVAAVAVAAVVAGSGVLAGGDPVVHPLEEVGEPVPYPEGTRAGRFTDSAVIGERVFFTSWQSANTTTVTAIDLESGSEEWTWANDGDSSSGEAVGLVGVAGRLAVIEPRFGPSVTLLDLESGAKTGAWRLAAPWEIRLVTAAGMVIAEKPDGVAGFRLTTGAEVWATGNAPSSDDPYDNYVAPVRGVDGSAPNGHLWPVRRSVDEFEVLDIATGAPVFRLRGDGVPQPQVDADGILWTVLVDDGGLTLAAHERAERPRATVRLAGIGLLYLTNCEYGSVCVELNQARCGLKSGGITCDEIFDSPPSPINAPVPPPERPRLAGELLEGTVRLDWTDPATGRVTPLGTVDTFIDPDSPEHGVCRSTGTRLACPAPDGFRVWIYRS